MDKDWSSKHQNLKQQRQSASSHVKSQIGDTDTDCDERTSVMFKSFKNEDDAKETPGGQEQLIDDKQVDNIGDKDFKTEYKTYPYRWVLLISYTITFCVTGFIKTGFSSVAETVREMFQVDVFYLQMQSLLFLILYVPSNFTVIYLQDKKGLRVTLIVGSVLLLVGCWMRSLIMINDNFYLIFIGTSIIAYSQGFFVNSTSKLSSQWFGDKERAFSTALGSLSIPIGGLFGFVIPTFMISDHDTDPQVGLPKFYNYLLLQNILATVCTIPLIFLARDKPPTPPSSAASHVKPKFQFLKELKNLVKNPSYLLLAVSYMCLDSITTSISAIIASLTKPYDFKGPHNAIFAVTYIVAGVVGSFAISVFLDRKAKFKITIIILSFCAILASGLQYLALPSKSVIFYAVSCAVFGIFTLPMSPLSFAFSVELTFPIPEAMSNGMIVLFNKLSGALLGILAGSLCKMSPTYPLILFTAMTVTAFLCSLFIKEQLRRLHFKQVQLEEQNRLSQQSQYGPNSD